MHNSINKLDLFKISAFFEEVLAIFIKKKMKPERLFCQVFCCIYYKSLKTIKLPMDKEFIHRNPIFIQKIKRLLTTNDPANADLAFQLMSNEGIPDTLHSDSINTQEKVLLCLKYQLKAPLKLVKLLDLSTYKQPLNDYIHHVDLMENLECLDLSWHKMSHLPNQIFTLKKLRILQLKASQLMTLSSDIACLQNLTHLNLSNNQLKVLPDQLGKLSKLEYLTLTSNQIDFLPESLANLHKLRKMILWDNPLSKFEIAKIKNLLPNTKVELEVNNLH